MGCRFSCKYKFTDEFLDVKDNDGLTPFYLLCEEGFRKGYEFNEDDEAWLEGAEKTIANEMLIS